MAPTSLAPQLRAATSEVEQPSAPHRRQGDTTAAEGTPHTLQSEQGALLDP